MKAPLARTLTLAFLLVAVTAAGLLAVFVQQTSPERFGELIIEQNRSEFKSLLIEYYTTHGSWEGVTDYLRSEGALGQPPTPPYGNDLPLPETRDTSVLQRPNNGGMPPPQQQDRRLMFGLADADGIVVIPIMPQLSPATRLSSAELRYGEQVLVNNQTVGTILTPRRSPDLKPEELAYLQRLNHALLLATLVAVAVALAVGMLLARTLTSPLRALTQAVQRMTGGDLEQEVKVTSHNEIGQLAQAFNHMSRALALANRQRRQMTADIAHDLRTPLTVIAGYIEAMQEGELEATPERLALIYADVERLQRLVDDLRTLSRADAGELSLYKQPLSPGSLLEQAAALYRQRAEQQKVHLRVEVQANLPMVNVDEDRMAQVMGNLITNALHYTPPGGEILLQASQQGQEITLAVQDSGEGITPEDLEHIFDRFYRADKTRHDDEGSGLGLAIVRSLVESHGGRVEALSTPGQGARLLVHLPVDSLNFHS